MKIEPLLHIAKKVAREAGSYLIGGYSNLNRVEVKQKALNDYVSTIDIETERFIVESLKKARKDDLFITEETTEIQNNSEIVENQVTWIIDPLDGTRNFIMGNPHFAISIAAIFEGQLVVAVVYNPINDEMYIALKGGGSYFNDTRLRINRSSGIKGKIISTGLPYKNPELLPEQLNIVQDLVLNAKIADLRRTGSAALDLCYVAANRFDAYYEKGIKKWDIAAGALIVKEAGGFVIDMQGGEDYLNLEEIIAGHVNNVKELVKSIRNVESVIK